MVGDDDPVHPVLDRGDGVGGMQDPLEEDRQSRPLAQEREVVPGERRARVRLHEPAHRGAREAGADVRESRPGIRPGLTEQRSDRRECDPARCRCLLPQRLLERFDEHRVARVLRDPLSAEERQVREIEVANPPAEHRRVEREDDRAAPAPLSPRDEARDELVRRAPVELEPARCVAHGTCCFLHRARGLVREDERDALRGGCARNGHVRVAVGHLQDADRTEDERARQRGAEHLGRGCPDRDVAEHPRHDAPTLERRAVLAHRLLGSRAARDVGESLRRHGLSRRLLETLERDGNGRIRAPRAADVDLELSLAPDADGHACTLTASP